MNYVSDRLSRNPQMKKDCPEFPGEEISISNKSRRVLESSIETKDPMLDAMSKNDLDDPDYQYMIQCIQNKTPIDQIKKDSELFKMEGSFQILSTIQTKSGSLIVKDNSEVLIPLKERDNIISILHENHAGDRTMMAQCKNNFFWPHIRDVLKSKFLIGNLP